MSELFEPTRQSLSRDEMDSLVRRFGDPHEQNHSTAERFQISDAVKKLTAELALFKITNDFLRVAVDVGLAEINSLIDKLDKFEQGYQGSCLACEPVGMLNLELTAEVTRMTAVLDSISDPTKSNLRHVRTIAQACVDSVSGSQSQNDTFDATYEPVHDGQGAGND